MERVLLQAETPEQCWRAVLDVYRTFGFAGIRIDTPGFSESDWDPAINHREYSILQLPAGSGVVELAREIGCPVLPACAIPFAELVAKGFGASLAKGAHTEDDSSTANVLAHPAR
jgi:hypothetical protein